MASHSIADVQALDADCVTYFAAVSGRSVTRRLTRITVVAIRRFRSISRSTTGIARVGCHRGTGVARDSGDLRGGPGHPQRAGHHCSRPGIALL